MRTSAVRDVRAAVAAAARRAEDPVTLERSVAQSLSRVLPYDLWCGILTDPGSEHPTGGYHDEGLPTPVLPRLLEIENGGEPDFVALRELAHAPRAARTLSDATGGDLARSTRYRDVLEPSGVRHEVRVALRTGTGIWGALVLMRGGDVPDFTAEELALLTTVGPVVAEGLCRTVVLRRAATAPAGPGVLLCTVDEEIRVDSVSESARRRLSELADGVAGELPACIASLVHAARWRPPADGPRRARMRTRRGEWVTVHAERLGPTLVSVVLEPTRPHEVAELWADAHGLTARERDVAGLAVRGLTNAQIAEELFLSPWTVQDHLKQVFAKTGVSGRTELASALLLEVGAAGPLLGSGGRRGAPGRDGGAGRRAEGGLGSRP